MAASHRLCKSFQHIRLLSLWIASLFVDDLSVLDELSMTGKTVMRYSPKYARDGAKMVRCALDQCSKVRDLIRCANYICALGCQASGEILYSPKYARDGVKMVRCALDQSSKVRDLIRCVNYIYILWVVKHRAQCYWSGAKLFSVKRNCWSRLIAVVPTGTVARRRRRD